MDDIHKKHADQTRELVALRARVSELEAANTTGCKQTEEKLAFHAQLLAGVHDAITATDENHIITYWNSMAEKMFGWTAEEAIGKHIGHLLQTKVPGSSREAVIEGMRKEKYYKGEAIYRHNDGSDVYASVHSTFATGSDSTLRGFISTFRDITGQKQAEEALRQARDYLEEKVAERTKELSLERQRLLDVLETLPVNICLLTTDYQVPFANRAFRERYGDSYGRCCHDYIFGHAQPCEDCMSFQPLETGQPYHWLFSAPDGSMIDVYDFPFTDTDGSSLILEMNVDITEQRRAETEIARLDRLNMIGDMAASIGHEIRNPITAVRGFL